MAGNTPRNGFGSGYGPENMHNDKRLSITHNYGSNHGIFFAPGSNSTNYMRGFPIRPPQRFTDAAVGSFAAVGSPRTPSLNGNNSQGRTSVENNAARLPSPLQSHFPALENPAAFFFSPSTSARSDPFSNYRNPQNSTPPPSVGSQLSQFCSPVAENRDNSIICNYCAAVLMHQNGILFCPKCHKRTRNLPQNIDV